ncbi:MAG: hypothetical protein J1E80_02060 [Desulfovibrionaceae bacterium]|nr:hypothetical protein [Desulfovibrionaceae bacterium]
MRLPLLPTRRVRLMRPLAAVLLLTLLMPAAAWAQPGAERSAAEREGPSLNIPEGGLALTPFLDFLLDPSGKLDIAEVSAADRAQDFRRFRIHVLRQQAGTLWLRFRLAPASAASATVSGPAQTRLDLGGQVPGKVSVWTRTADHPPVPAEAREGLFSLAGLNGGGEVFVRLDGLPGLWFAPALRTVSDSLSAPDRRVHPLLLAALATLLMLCLVRGLTERGDGRLWTGALIGAALLHALWGAPSTPGGTVTALSMPGLMAAGVALMLLPHVGRSIMHTRDGYPRLDMLLLVLALPGAALAVLPLLPGFAWTARLFSLWPLGAAFALLPALILLAYDVPGSALFSLACLGLVTGGGLAVWGVNQGLAAPLWEQAALAGIVFASLLLTAAAPRSAPSPWNAGTDETPPLDSDHALSPEAEEQAREDSPPPLRLEEILRDPLDTLLREACLLDQILDQPDGEQPLGSQDTRQARRRADNLVAAAREMSTLVSELPRLARRRGAPESKRQVFDLLKLVQSVFADVSDTLQKGDLGLSWYIAPHLGRLYRGDRDRLRFVLSMLLENAARATDQGAVSLRVRRADMSPNPGHLQFTVADTGGGTPPLRRSSLALAKAWELAADHGGNLYVDSTPQGMEISFSLNCVALNDDAQTPRPVPPAAVSDQPAEGEPNPRLVILASPQALNRQMLAFFLEDQGQDIWEARDAQEAAALYAHSPAALVVFDGRLPEEDIVTAVASIRAFEGERSLPATPFLALTLDGEQAERLRQAGCDHSLPMPVRRGEFQALCLSLASPSGPHPGPAALPHRVSPSRAPEIPARNAVGEPDAPAPDAGHAVPGTSPDMPTGAPLTRKPGPAAAPDAPALPDTPARGQAPTPNSAPPLTMSAQPLASQGLHLPPQPRKRLSWLSGLLKPTPRIAPEALDDILPDTSSEWVGEPMPITASPHASPGASQPASHPDQEDPASGLSLATAPGPDLTVPQTAARPPMDEAGAPDGSPAESPATADSAGERPAEDDPARAASLAENDGGARLPASPARERTPAYAEEAGANGGAVRSGEAEPADEPPVQAPAPRTAPAKGRHKHGGKHKRRKNRMDNVPFLSMDRHDAPEPVRTSGAGGIARLELRPPAGPEPDSGDIVELTEADVVHSSLVQQAPDLLRVLTSSLEQADSALERRNPQDLINAADRMADQAAAFGLHALSDVALCMKEAAQRDDFETVAQLVPELRAEVARHRRDG